MHCNYLNDYVTSYCIIFLFSNHINGGGNGESQKLDISGYLIPRLALAKIEKCHSSDTEGVYVL